MKRARELMLVCEGACNSGAVQVFDQAVKAAGRRDVSANTAAEGDARMTTLLDPRVLDDARAFAHTLHQPNGVVFNDVADAKLAFVCEVCGTSRVCGFA